MPRFDGDENAATGGARFSAGVECCFHDRAIALRLHDDGAQGHRARHRRGPQQLHRKFGCNGTRWRVALGVAHQVMRRRPVHVAIEQCADDATVQHARECFVMRLRAPLGHVRGAVKKAANAQPLRVRGAAAEAGIRRRIAFLQALFIHAGESSPRFPARQGRNCPSGKEPGIRGPGMRYDRQRYATAGKLAPPAAGPAGRTVVCRLLKRSSTRVR